MGKNYVISDIHGCLTEFKALLKKINLSEDDNLYILGDVLDRGEHPIQTLQEIMGMSNVIFILGNHDYIAYKILKKLSVEITEENYENHVNEDDILMYSAWMIDGGASTVKEFTKLKHDDKTAVLEYIADASMFEEIFIGDKRYVLSHAGVNNYSDKYELDEYELYDFIDGRMNYKKRLSTDKNTFFVTGHTPTMLIRSDKKPLVYKKNGFINIDCGCVFGGKLAAYCLDTEKVFYVDRGIL